MKEQLAHVRKLCLEQAQGFIDAADLLSGAGFRHIVYHFSLLALEGVGMSSMLGARMVGGSDRDGSWIERSLENHRRKLQWAVWSPIVRLFVTLSSTER